MSVSAMMPEGWMSKYGHSWESVHGLEVTTREVRDKSKQLMTEVIRVLKIFNDLLERAETNENIFADDFPLIEGPIKEIRKSYTNAKRVFETKEQQFHDDIFEQKKRHLLLLCQAMLDLVLAVGTANGTLHELRLRILLTWRKDVPEDKRLEILIGHVLNLALECEIIATQFGEEFKDLMTRINAYM
jgi:hypothetical protein